MPLTSLYLWTDGACDNSGKGFVGRCMGCGIVIRKNGTENHPHLLEVLHMREGTSYIAEWVAMLRGLTLVVYMAREVDAKTRPCPVFIYADNLSMVNQMKGEWDTTPSNAHYKRQAITMLGQLRSRGHYVTIAWIPRAQNAESDILSQIGRKELKAKRPGRSQFKTIDQAKEHLKTVDHAYYRAKRDRDRKKGTVPVGTSPGEAQ